jgi:hypothetical protein
LLFRRRESVAREHFYDANRAKNTSTAGKKYVKIWRPDKEGRNIRQSEKKLRAYINTMTEILKNIVGEYFNGAIRAKNTSKYGKSNG